MTTTVTTEAQSSPFEGRRGPRCRGTHAGSWRAPERWAKTLIFSVPPIAIARDAEAIGNEQLVHRHTHKYIYIYKTTHAHRCLLSDDFLIKVNLYHTACEEFKSLSIPRTLGLEDDVIVSEAGETTGTMPWACGPKT